MIRNSDILFAQVRDHPDDLTLLSMYHDALIEDGYPERAGWVAALIEETRNPQPHPGWGVESRKYILKRRLLILPLMPRDLVTVDCDGRFVPFIAAERESIRFPVGEVDRVLDDGSVIVRVRCAEGYPVGSREVLWR